MLGLCGETAPAHMHVLVIYDPGRPRGFTHLACSQPRAIDHSRDHHYSNECGRLSHIINIKIIRQ